LARLFKNIMRAKRIVRWSLAGIAILLILAAIGGYSYLKSTSFQHFALRQIVEKANDATGGRTEIGGLNFDLGTLTAHLYNITLHGTEASDQPPLLRAEELTIRLQIISAIHRKVTLREVVLNHPVLYLQRSHDGTTNVPTPPPAPSTSGSTNIFDLGVGHVQLSRGEVNYGDRSVPLEASLYNLGANIRFESLARRYIGNVSYKNGSIAYGNYAPLPHNLNVQFQATPDRFNLDPLVFEIASSQVTLRAQISGYSNPVVDGDYRILIHTQDFAGMVPSVRPAGDVSLTGKLHYQSVVDRPLLQSIALDGLIGADRLSVIGGGKRLELQKIEGTYRLAGGDLEVSNLSLNSMGGRIVASARINRLDATPVSNVRASLDRISVSELQRVFAPKQASPAALSGTIGGTVSASWSGNAADLQAHSDLIVQAKASSKSTPSAGEIPVRGTLHVAYDSPRRTVEVHDTVLRIPSATLTAQGAISRHSSLQLQMVADDLHQLAALAYSFGTTQGEPLLVSGSATVNAVVQGSIDKPTVNARLSAQNLGVEGSQWKTAKLSARADASRFVVDDASIVNAKRGAITLSASIALKNWAYLPANPVKAHLQVKQMPLLELQHLARQTYPISGDLSADATLEGSQLRPAGSGSAQLTNAHAYGEPLQTVSAKFSTNGGAILSTLQAIAPAGKLDANLTYNPSSKAYKVHLTAPAVDLQKLHTVQERNIGMSGSLSASADGEGTIDNPELKATVQLPDLLVRQNHVSNFKAAVEVAQHHATLNLDSTVAQASIHAQGDIALTDRYETSAVIDTGTVPLGPLMAVYAPSMADGFRGEAQIHATLRGPLKDVSEIKAQLSIPVLKAKYGSFEIGIARPVHVDFADSVVTLQPADIRGTETSLRAQGRIPLAGGSNPTLTAQGSINLRILQMFSPDIQSAGVVALDVRASGTTAKPEIAGQLQLQNVALNTLDAPVGIEKLNGTVDITNDRFQLSKMTAVVGGGAVTLGGSISYRPALQFNVALQGKSIRLAYPEGLRSLLEANLTLSGDTHASMLSGRVLIDSLSFTPDFDLSSFSDQFSNGNTLSQPGIADTVKLSIALQSQQNLNAVSSQVSIAGQAALQIGGTAANPVITGRTTLTSGELFYRNVRYQLQRGIVTFDNPNETHPVLNVSVTTIVEQYNLTLNLRGPLDKLTTSYVSDPPLPTADVINLVARGKTTEEAAASSQSTDSMVASQVAGQVAGSVQKLAGISALEIDPTLGGNQNPSARVAIQQRVTKNLLFSFSTDVSQPGSEIVQGEYQINKRWSVSVQRDQLGGVSVDGRFHKKF
jgi:translocation and assembly module TamB